MSYTVGSLFAGIGGFDLGFERAGFKTVWQVEIDPDCRKVLAHQFPEAKRFDDIRQCGANNLGRVDVIAGGFPCQDISIGATNGQRVGLDGLRSGLWFEMLRVVRELRPRFVLIENVAAILGLGLERVLCDLAAIGFDAQWDCIPASAIGANHQRDRFWAVAYSSETGLQRCFFDAGLLESAKAAFSESGDEVFGGGRSLHAAIQCLPSCDGLSVGMVRRLVAPFGNAVVPQIPQAIARRIKQALDSAAPEEMFKESR